MKKMCCEKWADAQDDWVEPYCGTSLTAGTPPPTFIRVHAVDVYTRDRVEPEAFAELLRRVLAPLGMRVTVDVEMLNEQVNPDPELDAAWIDDLSRREKAGPRG